MIDLNNFKTTNDHEKILLLEGEEFNKYKLIACIHLGRYTEGLKYSLKNTFESAYLYYKLKKYKKALRICNKNKSEYFDMLKSQILYCLGYYNEAFNLLNKFPKDDEIVVNLQAMKSLGILVQNVNKVIGHPLYIKNKEDKIMYEDLENYKFKSKEIYNEFLYNKSFEKAYDKNEFKNYLKNYSNQKSNIFSQQLANIEGKFDSINIENLSKTQKNILEFNMKKKDFISNNLHFLDNYNVKLGDNEFKWINAIKNNSMSTWYRIPTFNEKFLILRLYAGIKSKEISNKEICIITKKINDEDIKTKIEKFLSSNN